MLWSGMIYIILKMTICYVVRDANKKLQDTNDHMQSMVDMPAIALNSPR